MYICMYIMYAYAPIYGVAGILRGYYLTAEQGILIYT